MIRLSLPLDPKSGKRLDISCPVIVCDHCGRFIDKDHPGNLLWADGDPKQFHVHKACDHAFKHVHLSRDIDEWLAQLANNYTNPLQRPGGIEVTLYSGSVFRVSRWELEGDLRAGEARFDPETEDQWAT